MTPGAAGKARFRRVSVWLGVAMLAFVAGVGMLHSPSAAGAGELSPATPGPSAAAAGTATAFGQSWSGGGLGIDLVDLAWKGLLVLVLLFITLRVLARLQGAGQPRRGNLNVLESRTLAPKASLHLVAVGERRLVVGLTPNGMVALAELDADELPDADEPAAAESVSSAERQALAGPAAPSTVAGFSGSFAGSFVAPVDRFADRLASLLRPGSGLRGGSRQ